MYYYVICYIFLNVWLYGYLVKDINYYYEMSIFVFVIFLVEYWFFWRLAVFNLRYNYLMCFCGFRNICSLIKFFYEFWCVFLIEIYILIYIFFRIVIVLLLNGINWVVWMLLIRVWERGVKVDFIFIEKVWFLVLVVFGFISMVI